MNILLVDDQKAVLESMKIIIDWQELGVEGVYTAGSSREAKEIAGKISLDILVTDIEMPIEDGIALARWFFENYPDVKCIFLTSHADFSYAKEAIKIGGFDYILQPAMPNEIREVIGRCVQNIKKERQILSLAGEGKAYKETQPQIMEGMTLAVFNSRGTRLTVEKWEKMVNVERRYTWGIPLWIDHYNRMLKKKDLQAFEAISGVNCKHIFVDMGLQKRHYCYGGILYGGEEVPKPEKIKQFAEQVLKWVKSLDDGKMSLYVGMDSEEGLSALVEAVMNLWDDNVEEKEGIFYSKRTKKSFRVREPKSDEWIKWMESGDGKLVQNQIRNLIGFMSAEGTLTLDYMKKIHGIFDEACVISCYSMGIRREELFDDNFSMEDFRKAYLNRKDFERAVSHCIMKYNQLLRLNQDVEQELSLEERIQKVMEYIDRNVTENVSRSEAAEMAILSEDYFTKVFKQQTGYGFKEYVLKRKMDYSQRLLKETNFQIGVIAMKVGYSNFSNFTYQFRKYTGLSPQEYRDSLK